MGGKKNKSKKRPTGAKAQLLQQSPSDTAAVAAASTTAAVASAASASTAAGTMPSSTLDRLSANAPEWHPPSSFATPVTTTTTTITSDVDQSATQPQQHEEQDNGNDLYLTAVLEVAGAPQEATTPNQQQQQRQEEEENHVAEMTPTTRPDTELAATRNGASSDLTTLPPLVTDAATPTITGGQEFLVIGEERSEEEPRPEEAGGEVGGGSTTLVAEGPTAETTSDQGHVLEKEASEEGVKEEGDEVASSGGSSPFAEDSDSMVVKGSPSQQGIEVVVAPSEVSGVAVDASSDTGRPEVATVSASAEDAENNGADLSVDSKEQGAHGDVAITTVDAITAAVATSTAATSTAATSTATASIAAASASASAAAHTAPAATAATALTEVMFKNSQDCGARTKALSSSSTPLDAAGDDSCSAGPRSITAAATVPIPSNTVASANDAAVVPLTPVSAMEPTDKDFGDKEREIAATKDGGDIPTPKDKLELLETIDGGGDSYALDEESSNDDTINPTEDGGSEPPDSCVRGYNFFAEGSFRGTGDKNGGGGGDRQARWCSSSRWRLGIAAVAATVVVAVGLSRGRRGGGR